MPLTNPMAILHWFERRAVGEYPIRVPTRRTTFVMTGAYDSRGLLIVAGERDEREHRIQPHPNKLRTVLPTLNRSDCCIRGASKGLGRIIRPRLDLESLPCSRGRKPVRFPNQSAEEACPIIGLSRLRITQFS